MIKSFITFLWCPLLPCFSALETLINPPLQILVFLDLKWCCGQLMYSMWSYHPFCCLQRQICVLRTSSNDIRNSLRKTRNWFLILDPFCPISSTFLLLFQCHQVPMSFTLCPKRLFYFVWFSPSHIPPVAHMKHSQFQPEFDDVKKNQQQTGLGNLSWIQ